MPRRDHAGVAPARPGGGQGVALEDDDLVAVFLQLIGGRHPDDAAPQNDYPHRFSDPAPRASKYRNPATSSMTVTPAPRPSSRIRSNSKHRSGRSDLIWKSRSP